MLKFTMKTIEVFFTEKVLAFRAPKFSALDFLIPIRWWRAIMIPFLWCKQWRTVYTSFWYTFQLIASCFCFLRSRHSTMFT